MIGDAKFKAKFRGEVVEYGRYRLFPNPLIHLLARKVLLLEGWKEAQEVIVLAKMTAFIKKFRYNASLGWEKFTSFLPIYGLRGTVTLLMKNLLWVEMQYRLEKDLSTGDPPVYPKIPINVVPYCKGFHVGSWDFKDQIARIRGKFALRRFQQRLDRDEVLFVGYWQDNIVGFVWIQFPPHTEAGYPLSDDEAYPLDSWVCEEHRGKRVSSTISQTLKNYVRNNRPEIKKLVTHVAVKNRAAMSGVLKSGYIITRKEISFALFGVYRRFVLQRSQSSL